MDNYEKQVYTGRELFLKYNQDKLIEKYGCLLYTSDAADE